MEVPMKRTDGHVDLDLYAAVFKDIVAWDSNLRQDLDADFRRLGRTVATRGMSFIMIDMPDAGTIIDSALSSDRINSETLPKTFGKVKDRGTREFLSCIFELVFDGSGYLRDDVNPTAVFFLRTVCYMAKKVREDCSDAAISAEVENFRKVEVGLRAPYLDWECDTLNLDAASKLSFTDGYVSEPGLFSDRDRVPRSLLSVLDQVTGIVFSQFPELDWREITPRHGSGAVADLQTGTDKYQFRYWPNKLEGTFPSTYFAQSREDLHLEAPLSLSNHEPPAKLLAVPKTLKGPRLIASEPTAHQYLQQGLMRWIREFLPLPLRLCIDFKSQVPSRDACLEASKNGESATVDLSSASDRLSCWVVERALRTSPSLLRALHASRTRWLVNHTGVGERFFIKLKKFAAQGSAVTFPVQSMVYACMAIACVLYEKSSKVTSRNIVKAARELRIFGDDIIMPSHAVWSLSLLMGHCDLKVNVSKTHYQGKFRESCGMDAFGGVDVTPLYLRSLSFETTPDGIASWIDVCNNAYSKGLWSLSDAMIRKIPPKIRKLIPVSSEDLGVLSLRSYQAVSSTGRIRLCRNLHREETYGLQLVSVPVSRSRETHQNLLQYFVEDPSPETKWSAGYLVRVRSQLRKRWVLAKRPG
jgi:hypothetical protein